MHRDSTKLIHKFRISWPFVSPLILRGRLWMKIASSQKINYIFHSSALIQGQTMNMIREMKDSSYLSLM